MESKNVLIDELKNLLKNAKNETQAIEIKNIFNKTKLNPLYAKLKEKADKEKNIFGKLINEIKIESNEIIEQKINYFKSLEEKNNHIVNYDISINTTNLEKGALNPISLVIQDILGYFESLNFTIQSGEEVMSIKYNFDNLNIPLTHPTREASETFYTDDGWSLRTQNTASSAQFMDNNQDEEIKVANFGYVYRNDEDDATHSHQFNQVDFIWIKKGINVKNLKWVINGFVKHLFGEATKTRFRLSNFPFTEPSFEVDASCPFCDGKGCNKCKQSGWIELLGAGIFREKEVLSMAKIKNKTGIAAGMGIERMAMIKYGISDIRDLYNNNFKFLKQFVE